MVDFLVFGATGYFGSHVVKWLRAQGRTFAVTAARVEFRAQVLDALDTHKPKYVICAAGLAGTPNIDWFETHRQEGIRVNVLGTLNVVDCCYLRGIHCTIFGTGFVFAYDDAHPLGSGLGFKEEDPPNFSGPFYVQLRIQLEALTASYPNLLNLRISLPISDDGHGKSLIGKLVSFAKVISVPNSVTVIDDLFPLIPQMAEKGLVGNFHFANPGVITNHQILTSYKKFVDPEKSWRLASVEEQQSLQKAGRPNHHLDVSKLLAFAPTIKPIEQSIDDLMIRLKEVLRSQGKEKLG